MKAMNNFKKYKKGIITMEIQSLIPEKFINLLWRNEINIKNVKKINITTVVLEVKLSDYGEISKLAKKVDAKIKILNRQGISFFLIKIKNRFALLLGIVLFGCIIYYLSSFIWDIEINTEAYISPYELRHQIEEFGVKTGLRKKNIDVYSIENKITRSNDKIMWVRARIEGIKLKVDIIERQSPPIIIRDETPRDLIASKDGIIVRVYTSEGTSIVQEGNVIQKGDLLVKGEQGKEGGVYPVHAKGQVIAKTFYEEIKEVPFSDTTRVKTGKSIKNLYIKFNHKRIYIKNSLIPYVNYDKIEENSKFAYKEWYYEVEEKTLVSDAPKVAEEMYTNMLKNLDKTVKVIDKIIDIKKGSDKYLIRVLVVAEENIVLEDK